VYEYDVMKIDTYTYSWHLTVWMMSTNNRAQML